MKLPCNCHIRKAIENEVLKIQFPLPQVQEDKSFKKSTTSFNGWRLVLGWLPFTLLLTFYSKVKHVVVVLQKGKP